MKTVPVGTTEADVRGMHKIASEIMETWRKAQCRKYRKDREAVSLFCGVRIDAVRGLLAYWIGQPWESGPWNIDAVADEVKITAVAGEEYMNVPAPLLLYLTSPLVERWDAYDREQEEKALLDYDTDDVKMGGDPPVPMKRPMAKVVPDNLPVPVDAIFGVAPKTTYISGEILPAAPGEVVLLARGVPGETTESVMRRFDKKECRRERLIIRALNGKVLVDCDAFVKALEIKDVLSAMGFDVEITFLLS